ncbi:MAG TPA: AMP-binding protein [Candidatus Competibacter sp.]|nr:long-chain-fatty-acid--CoA ligase [Candidatus Competibacteraceae bacterium]HRC73264.1 AMP-binding protein [Candidatus Competibacter sp.]
MEKVWLNSYPPKVPADINPDQYRSLVEVFERSCCQFGRRHAFASMGYSMSYNELEQKSRALAVYLQQELGLEKGERVAIMLPNLLQYPVALFGVLRAGLVVVNIDPLSAPRELEHQLKDSGAKAIVILANLVQGLADVIANTQIGTTLVTEIGDLLPYWKAKVVNLLIERIKNRAPVAALSNAIAFKEALATGNGRSLNAGKLNGEDLAFLQYTSGTTGPPKGAMLTHRNMVANMEQCIAFVGPLLREGEEIIITVHPLHRIFYLTLNCLCFVRHGGLNVLLSNPRDRALCAAEMRRWKFTVITGDDELFNSLMQNEKFRNLDFGSLKLAIGGGTAVQQAVAERWRALTGIPLLESYELTEASPLVCINPVDLGEFNGSVGLPLPSTDIQLRGPGGGEVAAGGRGELCVRGPQVMRGYWEQPDATEHILCDGWLLTGDIATMNEQGFIRIVDRKKDMITVSGFNVFPNEIEDVVGGCEGVLEVACVGIPDEKTGEAVKICVVRKPGGALSADTILARCRQQLAPYKIPRHIEFRDDLPKSGAGKVLRHELR